MANANFSARYSMIAAKNCWEEQGFFFDDSQPNYGLEQFVYNRLNELGCNSAGEDHSTVRGRRVPTNAATINAILGLPDNEPSFYAMLSGFEEEDFELIKDYLCEEGTAWNTTGRNPHSVSRLSLRPEAKLWNTALQASGRSYQPGGQIPSWKDGLDQGDIYAKDGRDRCHPTQHGDANATCQPHPHRSCTHQRSRTLRPSRLTPSGTVSSHTTTTSPATTPAARPRSRESTPDSPLGSTPFSPPSPPAPIQSEEAAPPLHILQLRSQLQRIEARQLQFQEETKVFNQTLVKFLCFQFPSVAASFAQSSSPPPQPNISTAAQPSANTSAKAGATEELHFSSDDENDVFDWQSPQDHLQSIGPTPSKPATTVPILSAAPSPTTSSIAERPTPDSLARRKGKATAGRSFGRDIPSSPEDEEAEQRPAKRRR
ncbi:hypothetical protein V6N13_033442 [Hibiscus sabdariffa]